MRRTGERFVERPEGWSTPRLASRHCEGMNVLLEDITVAAQAFRYVDAQVADPSFSTMALRQRVALRRARRSASRRLVGLVAAALREGIPAPDVRSAVLSPDASSRITTEAVSA